MTSPPTPAPIYIASGGMLKRDEEPDVVSEVDGVVEGPDVRSEVDGVVEEPDVLSEIDGVVEEPDVLSEVDGVVVGVVVGFGTRPTVALLL